MFNDFDNSSSKVKTAIVPIAGLGLRMLPITKLIPKEMLPLVDRPIIQFIIDECIFSGIENIVLITHSSKIAIENYLDIDYEAKDILKYRNKIKDNFVKKQNVCCSLDVNIISIRQKLHKGIGLGNAILSAYPVIGNNPVVVILPDVLIYDHCPDLYTNNLIQMLERFSNTRRSQILLKEVNKKDIMNYGIVIDYRDVGKKFNGNAIEIIKIIEKPVNVEYISSNLAIVGRYVFSNKIWDALQILSNRTNKEMELTDAISLLITQEVVEGFYLKGLSYDCGNKLGYMQAFVDYGIRHKVLGKDFKIWLKSLFF